MESVTASENGTRWAESTLERQRSKGYRRSEARRSVVELLGRQACCLSAQEIHDALRGEGSSIGIASVYRVLEQLSRDGFVQRVDLGSGTTRFEPAYAGGEHHHHLVCDDCGKVEAFVDDDLERVLHKVEGRTGYAVAGHDVVLRGRCERCAE